MNDGYREFHQSIYWLAESGYKVQIEPTPGGLFAVTLCHFSHTRVRAEGVSLCEALKSACRKLNDETVTYTGSIKRNGSCSPFGGPDSGSAAS